MIAETKVPPEIRGINFTRVERLILEHLCDGQAHTLNSLKIYDSQADDKAVQAHILRMRRKIDCSRFRIYGGVEKNVLIYRLVIITETPKAHF